MSKYFSNKNIWITGASSGIGEELAYQLAGKAKCLILSARNTSELERVKENCDEGSTIIIRPLDLENSTDFESIYEGIKDEIGSVDILFNNGGVSQRSTAEDTSEEVDRRIMEINYFGNIALTKTVLPDMISKKSGHIVVTSSVAGKFGFFLRSSYSASKHALQGFYESLRLEQIENHIKVTLLVPGAVNTNMSVNALQGDGARHGKIDRMQNQGLDVKTSVHKILKAVSQQKEELIFGGKEKYPVYIKRWFPGLFTSIMKKQSPKG